MADDFRVSINWWVLIKIINLFMFMLFVMLCCVSVGQLLLHQTIEVRLLLLIFSVLFRGVIVCGMS